MAQTDLSLRLETFLKGNLPEYLDMLRQMVNINSFTTNRDGVNALAELTGAMFQDLGFTAETVDSLDPQFGRHLVMTRHGSSGRKIGLVSHLDTVFPPEEEIRNEFAWRPEGDRIFGPGTVDIKGGTVQMYMVLAALHAFRPELYDEITWVLLLDASEEVNGEHFGALCRERLEGPETLACLIFEGGRHVDGGFLLVRARKGMAIYEVNVEGKAAHAGTSHKQGANAIVQLAEVIQKLAAITDYGRQVTVNVGHVSGGTVTNRVPHQAHARLEMRTFEPEIYEAVMAEIESLDGYSSITSADGDAYACRTQVKLVRKTAPWPPNEATDRLIEIWQQAALELGCQVQPEERGGLSDGNNFWDTIPTVDGMGVSGNNAHCSERAADGSKEQEYCEISSFVPKAVLNVMGIILLAGGE